MQGQGQGTEYHRAKMPLALDMLLWRWMCFATVSQILTLALDLTVPNVLWRWILHFGAGLSYFGAGLSYLGAGCACFWRWIYGFGAGP